MPPDAVLNRWLEAIEESLELVNGCFREVLEDLGRPGLAALLTEAGAGAPPADRAEEPPELLDRELQVLSIAFQLLNLVEEHAAAEARRAGELTGGPLAEPGGWGQNLRQLRDAGAAPEDIAAALRRVRVEIVLTAHPTEAKRPIVLKQHRELFDTLRKLGGGATPRERDAARTRVKVLLERLWRTGEMFLDKPGIEAELEQVRGYFRVIFPGALPELDAQLRHAWRAAGFDPALLEAPGALPKLRFGNWVGGDRDGHPGVTPEVTRQALGALREDALGALDAQLAHLEERMCLSALLQPPPQGLLAAIETRAAHVEEHAAAAAAGTYPGEPWREFTALMRAALPFEDRAPENTYARPAELIADLDALASALAETGAGRLAREDVAPVVRAVESFGFHGAALDVRQNSAYHDRALQQLFDAAGLDAKDYAAWPEERRAAFLCAELESPRPLAPRGAALGDEARAVLGCFKTLAAHIGRHGPDGAGPYIVSMTRGLSDLLAVYVFARETGLLQARPGGPICLLRAAPLFETVDDLERAPDVLAAFLAHPIARASAAAQERPLQIVMVGYSDSTKGSGILAAQWRLHRAQEALAQAAREAGAELQFFHGRGGTFSRGAGPTHRFLEALPQGSLTGAFRVTEQGETIAQKYANPPTAAYNLELLLAGVAATAFKHRRPAPLDPALAALGDKLAQYSREAYEALIQGPGFLDFWSEATPIDALEASFIGSRPSRRTGQRTLEDLRAIPWVFSWIQARYYLPAWYGIGSAFQRLRDEDPADWERLCASIQEWRFLRYVLTNAETSIASAGPGLMRDYASLVRDPALREHYCERILGEYRAASQLIDEAFGAPRERRRPRMMKTIELRRDGLRFLHHRQIDLLREWRGLRDAGNAEAAARIVPSLLLSINAIASGQRTTG